MCNENFKCWHEAEFANPRQGMRILWQVKPTIGWLWIDPHTVQNRAQNRCLTRFWHVLVSNHRTTRQIVAVDSNWKHIAKSTDGVQIKLSYHRQTYHKFQYNIMQNLRIASFAWSFAIFNTCGAPTAPSQRHISYLVLQSLINKVNTLQSCARFCYLFTTNSNSYDVVSANLHTRLDRLVSAQNLLAADAPVNLIN